MINLYRPALNFRGEHTVFFIILVVSSSCLLVVEVVAVCVEVSALSSADSATNPMFAAPLTAPWGDILNDESWESSDTSETIGWE